MFSSSLAASDLPNPNSELRPALGVDLKIGLGVASNKEDPIASALVRKGGNSPLAVGAGPDTAGRRI